MKTQGLPGFRDFYPEETALRNHIFAVWRDVAQRYGFQEYEGPPLEPLELYVKKSGPEIVGQLYTFEDKGGRKVALRPEMTPSLARMVSARAKALKKPIRWFSIPQLLRYERPQRGRLREHYQLNMDIIGESGPLADAELIAATLDIMRACGLGAKDVKARISDRRVVRALLGAKGLSEAQAPEAFAHIDKLEKSRRDELAKSLSTSAGLTIDVANQVLSIGDIRGIDGVKQALAELTEGGDAGDDLIECVGALESMGFGDFVDVDLGIVRGLAYYTGIVFELFDRGGSLRAICGGGRYDGLLDSLGGVDLPAIGFGMGDVVLGELLRDRDLIPDVPSQVDVFLVAVTGEDLGHVLATGRRLRESGLRVEYALKRQSIAKQLKLAAARSAKYAVIFGPDERAAGEAVVRNLEEGSENRVALEALAKELEY
jgi:histidyl-tRNA synthetase